MAKHTVHPIPLYYHPKPWLTRPPRPDNGRQVELTGYVWCVEGTKEAILIDAGCEVDYLKERGEPATEVQTLDAGIRNFGLTFSDIDLVILTHLHFDHTGYARRFPKARFLVQQRELDFARNPHPLAAGAYRKDYYDGLNFAAITGDRAVCEGVSVVSTPGHTPGGQSVIIQTARGNVVISGLCTTKENFEPPVPGNKTIRVAIPAGSINFIEAYDSLLKIIAMADIVVPIHDSCFRSLPRIP